MCIRDRPRAEARQKTDGYRIKHIFLLLLIRLEIRPQRVHPPQRRLHVLIKPLQQLPQLLELIIAKAREQDGKAALLPRGELRECHARLRRQAQALYLACLLYTSRCV